MLSKSYTSVLEVRRDRKRASERASERKSERERERERVTEKGRVIREKSWKGKEIRQRANLKTH